MTRPRKLTMRRFEGQVGVITGGAEGLGAGHRAIGIDRQLGDARFGRLQSVGAALAQFLALGIERDRFVQRNLPAFQPAHNLLQRAQGILEGQRRRIGGYFLSHGPALAAPNAPVKCARACGPHSTAFDILVITAS